MVGPAGAERDGTVLCGVDEQPADVRVLTQGGDEPRVVLVQLLERQPALWLHQVDESQIARAEDDDLAVRDVILWALRLRPAGRLVCGVLDHRALLVTSGEPGHLPGGERPLD